MKIIKNILFPIRFTSYSLDIMEYVILFARSVRARLHLLHVITGKEAASFDELNEFFHTISTDPDAMVTRSALDQVDLVKVHIKDDAVWHGIVHYTAEAEIDMVMIAAHSPDPHPNQNLSSTTLKVLENCPCPVMVIRLPEERRQHQSRFEMTLQEIKKEISAGH